LELKATQHTACTSQDRVSVKPGSQYLLSFDYQSPGGKHAGYYVGFDDKAGTSVSGRMTDADDNWHTLSKVVTVPEGAHHLQLVVYAYQPGGTDHGTESVVHYDHFQLVAIPNVQDRFYLTSPPRASLEKPKKVTSRAVNPTKSVVHISGAATPFYLTTNETYNPKWRLELANSAANSWLPFSTVKAVNDADHVNLNTSMNGWYIDPAKLCQAAQSGCTRNADGSYDLQLVMEFTPQRWFYLGTAISGLAFLATVGYFLYEAGRDKQKGRWRWR
jgi:hypothetical protein